MIVSYTPVDPWSVTCLIFTSKDPFNNEAWSDPLVFPLGDIDPSLFWDDDGQVYLQFAGIRQQTIDLATGDLGPVSYIWNGSINYIPEGPHMFKRNGYYYLLIGEGGTELGHRASIARSKNIWGPYEGDPNNPLLSNQNTSEYFQTVGHADLFQDGSGNWWASALATRSGPAWLNYPMGRETVLTPVTWESKPDAWPIASPVRGEMSGWPFPPSSRSVKGSGPFVEDPDVVDFAPGSKMPANFVYWRFPPEGAFEVSSPGHPYTLRLRPSQANLTSSAALSPTPKLSLIMREQTDTLFSYSVDVVSFKPKKQEEEVGVTVFCTQTQHIDLGIVLLPSNSSESAKHAAMEPQLRFRVTSLTGNFNGTVPIVTKPIPHVWLNEPIRLQIDAVNDTHYSLFAASSKDASRKIYMGTAPATLLSGGDGRFTGTRLHALD